MNGLRQDKFFSGRLDAAPFASVFFCLVIFILLGQLLYTPGVRLHLPDAAGLAGTDRPTIAVALDASGRLYFANQMVTRDELRACLAAAVQRSPGPLTLLVQADRDADYNSLINLSLLAREAGIRDALLATLPRTFEARP